MFLNQFKKVVTLVIMSKRKKLEEPIIIAFEDYVKKHVDEGCWKSIDEIVEITGSPKTNIVKYFDSNNDVFVRNTNNKYTTRNLYNKYTPFHKLVIDQLQNKID